MSVYSDFVFEPVFSEPAPVSKKNIETKVEIEFFRPFPSIFIPNPADGKSTDGVISTRSL
jgi:hypothetical protein